MKKISMFATMSEVRTFVSVTEFNGLFYHKILEKAIRSIKIADKIKCILFDMSIGVNRVKISMSFGKRKTEEQGGPISEASLPYTC